MKQIYNIKSIPATGIERKMLRADAMVTLFQSVQVRNGTSHKEAYTLERLFEEQTADGQLKEQTQRLRALKAKDKSEYTKARAIELSPFVIGFWPKRGQLDTPVNLFVIDVDGVDEATYPDILAAGRKSPFVYRIEQSLGGGARLYVWCDYASDRKGAYMAVCEELGSLLGIPLKKGDTDIQGPHIDTATHDETRFWYPAHTPPELVYFAPDSESFAYVYEDWEGRGKGNRGGESRGKYKYEFTEEEKVQDVIRQITEARKDITQGVDTWFTKVLLPLAHYFGEAGRSVAHELSQYHGGYNPAETDAEFSRALSKDKGVVTIGSFLEHCKANGITYDAQRIIAGKEAAQVATTKPKASSGEESPSPADIEEKTAKAADQNKLERFLKNKFEFRFNDITRMPEYRRKGQKPWLKMDDYRLNSIVREAKLAGLKAASKSCVAETIESDFAGLTNPIQAYFEDLPQGDGTDYIGALVATVDTVADSVLFRKYFEKWLIGAVANVFILDKCANHQCLVLTGTQGAYKSTWIKNLCPPQLIDYYVERNLNPENKDDLFATAANLLYNMDDFFADCSAKKVNQFKGFITQNTVNARPPYGRYNINLPKICSFVGSSNEDQFLHDSTGSRRFLPFEVKAIDIEAAQAIDMDKVWAQAYRMFKEGFQYWLSKDDQTELQEHNEQYQVQSIEYELLIAHFELPAYNRGDSIFLSVTDILDKLQSRTTINRISKKKLGMELKRAGFEMKQNRINGKRVWGYMVVERSDYDRAGDKEIKTTEGEGGAAYDDWLK